MAVDSIDVADRLTAHLRSWVGDWPPPSHGVRVVGDPSRLEPTWDGSMRLLQAVGNGTGIVMAVPPDAADKVAEAVAGGLDRPGLGNDLGEILGVGQASFGTGVFRWTAEVDLGVPDLGERFEEQTDELPGWLAPFNGPRFVARDDEGRPIAGVGIKIHDRYGYELAVVTDEAARGRGVARGLVATAARWVLDQGAVPTYLHEPNNHASARVAEAVGFADQGWTVHGLWPRR